MDPIFKLIAVGFGQIMGNIRPHGGGGGLNDDRDLESLAAIRVRNIAYPPNNMLDRTTCLTIWLIDPALAPPTRVRAPQRQNLSTNAQNA